jgi:tRNA 2-thiouridine synthesizing protein A
MPSGRIFFMGNEIKNKIDLQGVSCPMNFVRTKAALASLGTNDLLEVILDEGDAMLNVPRSLKEEGHTVVNVVSLGAAFKLTVKKG